MPIEPTERIKHAFEAFRHLATLSAGAIVLQVGFLEKLFPQPKYKAFVAISIVAFTASIMSSLVSQWGLMYYLGHGSVERTPKQVGCAVLSMWGFFGIGLITAVSFALINLFTLHP